MAAVCLQRLPVISADCTTIEAEFKQMLGKVSLFGIKTAVMNNAASLFYLHSVSLSGSV